MFARIISFIVLLLLSTAIFCQITNPDIQAKPRITKSILINPSSSYHIEAILKDISGIFEARVHYASTANGPFLAKTMYASENDKYVCDIPLEEGFDALYYYIEAATHSGNYVKKPTAAPGQTYLILIKKGNREAVAKVSSEFGKLKVFPNPAKENVWIAFSSSSFDNKDHTLTLLIYDLYGRTCLEKKLSTDETQFRLNISHMASGSYLIILHDEWGRFMSEKLVIR